MLERGYIPTASSSRAVLEQVGGKAPVEVEEVLRPPGEF
jgi:hypothetical protein